MEFIKPSLGKQVTQGRGPLTEGRPVASQQQAWMEHIIFTPVTVVVDDRTILSSSEDGRVLVDLFFAIISYSFHTVF